VKKAYVYKLQFRFISRANKVIMGSILRFLSGKPVYSIWAWHLLNAPSDVCMLYKIEILVQAKKRKRR